jgi:hypothetical protein
MTTLPLGEWNGKSLNAVLDDKEEEGIITVEVKVPNPDGGNDLARLSINLPHRNPKKDAYINSFFVTSREDGKDTFKGLGKVLLCAVFKHLKDTGRLKDEDPVKLSADGGFINNKLEPGPEVSEEDLKEIIRKYPGGDKLIALKDRFKISRTLEQELIVVVTSINQTRELIKYYMGYGFEVIPGKDYGIHADMTSTVGKILSACSSQKQAPPKEVPPVLPFLPKQAPSKEAVPRDGPPPQEGAFLAKGTWGKVYEVKNEAKKVMKYISTARKNAYETNKAYKDLVSEVTIQQQLHAKVPDACP